MAELCGKATGVSKGRGGSMHLFDLEHRLYGGYGIVGGHLPLAVGAALAIQYREEDGVVMCIFGEGATNIGAFHESMNMAKVYHLPSCSSAQTTSTRWARCPKRTPRFRRCG
jgi:pyruvate dehydrogenase E1 component alpha subunit